MHVLHQFPFQLFSPTSDFRLSFFNSRITKYFYVFFFKLRVSWLNLFITKSATKSVIDTGGIWTHPFGKWWAFNTFCLNHYNWAHVMNLVVNTANTIRRRGSRKLHETKSINLEWPSLPYRSLPVYRKFLCAYCILTRTCFQKHIFLPLSNESDFVFNIWSFSVPNIKSISKIRQSSLPLHLRRTEISEPRPSNFRPLYIKSYLEKNAEAHFCTTKVK